VHDVGNRQQKTDEEKAHPEDSGRAAVNCRV
jgi:hypothetical protein